MRMTTRSSSNDMVITVEFSLQDLEAVEPNSVEEKVMAAANPELVSDKLIAVAMMAKSVERAFFKKNRP
jgi:multidrug efflux pump subunit AcrB